MNRYRVIVTRDSTESTIVEVSAPSKKYALDNALFKVQAAPHKFHWRQDEGATGEPYLGDDSVDAVERIKP